MESSKSQCLICEDSYPQKKLSFVKFSKEESGFEMWIEDFSPLLDVFKVTPTSLNESGRICARHFKETDFVNFTTNSLIHNAYSSISLQSVNIESHKNISMMDGLTGEQIQREEHLNEKDMFQCGRCKAQFQLLNEFINHKQFQCIANQQLNKSTSESIATLQENFPLENIALNNFENKTTDSFFSEEENRSEEVLKIISEEPPEENSIVSFVVNDNSLLMNNPVDMSAFPGQVILSSGPPFYYNGLLIGNPVDVSSLAGQVILTPSVEGNPVFINNFRVDENVGGLIVTNPLNSNEMIYATPSEIGSDGLVFTTEIPNVEPGTQVFFTTETPSKPESDVDNSSANAGELNNTLDRTQLALEEPDLIEPKSVTLKDAAVNVSDAVDENEFDKTKTKLPCSYCGKVFEKPFNLQQHERIHTGERPFQCIICGRAFSQKSNVRKHMMRHKVWPHARQTLKITVDQTHKNQEVMDQMSYFCQYCSLSFKSYSLHKKHLTVHSNYKVYRCIQKGCDETFSDLDEFLSHSKMHSSAEFQCHICLKSFISLGELGAHQYDHDTTGKDRKEIEIKLKCKVCHAQFKTAESLKNHLAVDTHKYECLYCKTVFNSERFLRRHLFTHLDPSHSKFKCPNCKKTFRTQTNLNNHIFVHLKEKPFNCEHCSKQFASKYRLKRHLAIHLNQYFECPFKSHLGCEKAFYRKDKLRDHVSTHSHCRLRSCQICSKTYWSISKLNQHMNREHKTGKGKQMLKCVNCSQTFRKQKQLSQHHCTVSEKKFRSRGKNSYFNAAGKGRSSEAVSNIEIIMVPFDRDRKNGEVLT